MDAGAAIFFTDYSIGPAELGRALEERGLRLALGAGALAHPALARLRRFPRAATCPRSTTT